MLVAAFGKSLVEQAFFELKINLRIVEAGFLFRSHTADPIAFLQRFGFQDLARGRAEESLLEDIWKSIRKAGDLLAGETRLLGKCRYRLSAFTQAKRCFTGRVQISKLDPFQMEAGEGQPQAWQHARFASGCQVVVEFGAVSCLKRNHFVQPQWVATQRLEPGGNRRGFKRVSLEEALARGLDFIGGRTGIAARMIIGDEAPAELPREVVEPSGKDCVLHE